MVPHGNVRPEVSLLFVLRCPLLLLLLPPHRLPRTALRTVLRCVTLDGSFDLQGATNTPSLVWHGMWQSNAPFVGRVTITDNATAVAGQAPAQPQQHLGLPTHAVPGAGFDAV